MNVLGQLGPGTIVSGHYRIVRALNEGGMGAVFVAEHVTTLKQRALSAGRDVKKTEVLRAGLALLSSLSDADLLSALDGINKLKPGRPAK